MKLKEFLLLLGVAVVAAAAAAASLANLPLWFGITLYALSFVVGFGVSFVVDKWKQHRTKIKHLLDADKRKMDRRNRLQKNQSVYYNKKNTRSVALETLHEYGLSHETAGEDEDEHDTKAR